jgi:hypothetical protein
MTAPGRTGPDLAFIGPSLGWDEAQRIAPDVVLLPPAALGDVISAVTRYRPHAIALVDGSFLQNMAVFHKELIDAMARGVWVIGASSMGALRAAECADLGMIPVGAVADDFLHGRLVDDDEVALVHADAESGFRPLSSAMVELRATVAAAVAAGVISDMEADVLVGLQKRRWFPERSLAAVIADGRDVLGLSGHRLESLRDFVRSNRVDVKGDDARLALRALVSLPDAQMPVADRPVLVNSSVYRNLRGKDQIVDAGDAPGERPVRREDIRTHLALTDPGYHAWWREARQRVALAQLSRYLGTVPDDEQLAAARARLAVNLGVTVDELGVTALELDLDDDELTRMIEEEARVWALEEWVTHATRGVGLEHTFHDVLRLRGIYRAARSSAAMVEEMAAVSEEFDLELPLRHALAHHMAMTRFDLDASNHNIDTFIHNAGMETPPKFYDRLMTHVVAHRELLGVPVGSGLPALFDDDDHGDHAMPAMNARGDR